MARTTAPIPSASRRQRGFEAAAGLMKDQVRHAGESRGFAVARLLTHWPEIAGADLAGLCRPVKVGYGREGFGATLTLLVAGAVAPMVEMQKERLRERVNAAYGYAAISRILLTQTAARGFAEGQTPFAPAPQAPPRPDPAVVARAAEVAGNVQDADLRSALEIMARNVLARRTPKEST